MISTQDLRLAQERTRDHVLRTPLVPCPGGDLLLKPENLQPTGAFKLRGAFNKISSLSEDERARGVVAHSSGNHAQAVAYAAKALGVRAVIVMPMGAPPNKRRATESHGAEVVTVGNDSSERVRKAEELAAEQGLVPVPPYDDEVLIAGQGTVGMEIVEDLPDVDLVLVPVSGGGLISGVAAAVKMHRPEARVIGVEPELAADARQSLESGKIVEIPASDASRTIADGLRVRRLGEAPWEHIRAYVDDIVTVSEREILDSMRRLALHARLVAEPSGAVAFAAYVFHWDELPSTKNNVAVISGGNVEPELLARVLEKSLQDGSFPARSKRSSNR